MTNYWKLIKPGIVRGNLLTALAGYVLATDSISIINLIMVLVGIGLIIASGCVWNNIIDIEVDSKMSRTKNRPLVNKKISIINAYFFGSLIGIIGFILLYLFSNSLTIAIGLLSWLLYVFVYSYTKKNTNYGTIVGAIPGAMPPVAGYTAVTGSIDGTSIILFLILFWWQLPHFWAISIFRAKEYKEALIPTLPHKIGIKYTKLLIIICIIPFIFSVYALYAEQNLSIIFIIIMTLLSIYWLSYSIMGNKKDIVSWAKGVFGISLLILAALCILIILEFFMS
jgi:protoheme IX farnesyltransferase